ncbi:MAG: serine hydrolase domain-containing protein [Pseudomonadota bacterium]
MASFLCTFLPVGHSKAGTRFDARSIENWADPYFAKALSEKRLSGAALGIVQDGKVVYLRGYGWADLKNGVRFDPRRTLVRVCSTSKTFTATAAMQLVERGQIESLDTPINRYMKRFKLPEPYGDAVSLRHLLTHTSGMTGTSNSPQGIARSLSAPVSASELQLIFAESLVRRPDEFSVYSNLGVAVQGALIEDVSGLSLAEYMKQEIFKPLGMQSAVLHSSLAPPTNIAVPHGYFPDGSVQEVRFFPKHPATAASGGVILTPEDMLKYLAFHADEASQRHSDVLSGTARAQMHRRQFAHHAAADGIGLQFFTDSFAGQRVAHHNCGLPGTTTQIAVLPESNAGIVISVLSASPVPSVGDLFNYLLGSGPLIRRSPKEQGRLLRANRAWKHFSTALIGAKEFPTKVSPKVSQRLSLDELSGTYWSERRSQKSIAAMLSAGRVARVQVEPNGMLKVNNAIAKRVFGSVYEIEESQDRFPRRIVFRRLATDGPIYMHNGASNTWKKVHAFSNPIAIQNAALLGLIGSLLGFGAVFWSVRSQAQKLVKWIAVSQSLLVVAAQAVTLLGYRTIDGFVADYYNNELGRMTIYALLLNVYLALSVMLVGALLFAWYRLWWGSNLKALLCRLHLSSLALFGAMTWPAFYMFNILGLNLR